MNQEKLDISIDNFCVFILTHENPDDVKTWKALDYCNYTGKRYLVVDDKDTSISEYQETFGADKVLVFSKEEIAKTFDEMDIEGTRNTVVYARNACFQLAKQVGVRWFIELDDDYKEFQFRYEENDGLRLCYPAELDKIFLAAIEFLETSDKIATVALAQNGDFIGGLDSGNWAKFLKDGLLRKAMNTFICDVEKPFTFIGRINEDVNTYALEGSRGKLFFTFMQAAINQVDTQQKKPGAGMSAAYDELGTYQKSFYTVVCCPSFVKVAIMGDKYFRIHHNVDWNHGVPKILSDKYKRR